MGSELLLKHKFARIGAEVVFEDASGLVGRQALQTDLTIDVRDEGRRGEHYLVRHRNDALDRVDVIDLRPDLRHLLLMVREESTKEKILCGHDERHWFTCSLGTMNARGVVDAMEKLKPEQAVGSQLIHRVATKDRNRRRNAGYLRQGEWFFVPAEDFRPGARTMIHRNEPVMRSRSGKPHVVEELVRSGGEFVYTCDRYRDGLLEAEYVDLLQTNKEAAGWRWTTHRRNPEMFGRGAVRHSDHATIHLVGWHRILLNKEVPAGRGPNQRVVFFD